MASFRKLEIRGVPTSQTEKTPEQAYWSKFREATDVPYSSGVSCVDFNPERKDEFVVTCATQVDFYDGRWNEVQRSISKFPRNVHCASYRGDGQLLVVGGAHPSVQVFTVAEREALREFKGHTGEVRVAKFLPNNTHLFSGSNDKTVRHWDLSAGEQVSCMRGHTDHVRVGEANKASPNVIATGGYDHRVMVWDLRTPGTPIMNLDHGAPVEALVIFPDGGSIVSAGSNYIKIWDVLSGGRLLHTQSNHTMTVLTMFYDASHNRLFTGGLDSLLKVYELPSYTVVHTEKFLSPILSAGISPDRQKLLIGQNDKLSIRHRPDSEADAALSNQRVNRGSIRYFLNSVTTAAATPQHDLVLSVKQKSGDFSKKDNFLRQFEYKKALSEVLLTHDPVIIVSMLQELENRDGLEIAIAGRDEDSLTTLLQFLHKNLTNPLYTPYLIKICHLVLDIYSCIVGRSPTVDRLLNLLCGNIKRELAIQHKLLPLMGTLEFIINAAIAGMPIELSNENPATPVSPEIK